MNENVNCHCKNNTENAYCDSNFVANLMTV